MIARRTDWALGNRRQRAVTLVSKSIGWAMPLLVPFSSKHRTRPTSRTVALNDGVDVDRWHLACEQEQASRLTAGAIVAYDLVL